MNDIFMYNDEQSLRKLYIDERKSSWEIAEICNVSQATIMGKLKKFNIPRRSYKENPCPTRGTHLSEEHRRKIGLGNKGLIKINPETGHGYKWRRIEVLCSFCGKTLFKPKEYMKKHKHFFCNLVCLGHFAKGKNRGGSINVSCTECGKEIMRKKWQIKDGVRFFCSKDCSGIWKSKNLTGDKIYNFKGGYSRWENYGPSWPWAKKQALKRDNYTCQICGITKAQLKKNQDVHHLISFRNYGLEKHELANNLNNLISLCPKCHTTMEYETTSVLDKMDDKYVKALFCN